MSTTLTIGGRDLRLDAADAARLEGVSISVPKPGSRGSVTVYDPATKRSTSLARYVLGLPVGGRRVVWFRDGDSLNLTRENMRLVSRSELYALRGARTRGVPRAESVAEKMRDLSRNPSAKKRTGYHGVSLHRPTGRYNVRFRPPGEKKSLSFGYFDTEDEAAHAYDRVRMKFGMNPVNFSEERDA